MLRRRDLLRLLTPLLLLFPLAAAGAADKWHTPAPGSAERKGIMDALRVPVQKDVKQPVVFVARALRVQNNWAFLDGSLSQPNGKPLDYSHTKYQEALEAGAFDDGICALLKRPTAHGGPWKVVAYHIGATDVPYVDWDRQYHCPRAILGLPADAH